ncbi:DDE-domain-containing protein [Choiromyces venosus 120613-1]|uniref:DDE-domain-containing protein n=1 Tax=Choiromyces venosus 120613-1 TaxID=1336337 RepID=A0A3N4IRL9_9PEZI|nr:DDE-domain-containing protein [Choiromyces venosus 120613-1]
MSVSETGYSNDLLYLEWLKYFERFSAQRQVGAFHLLLLDGYGSHCTREFIAFCDEKNIIPFCLPPHTTHLLQLLDVVIFQSLKHYHAEAMDKATRTGCSDFNKVEFLSALTSIRTQVFKQTTIISAFWKTGLLPYNPHIVLSRLPEHMSNTTYSTQPVPTTPPPNPCPILSTPHTIRSLKRQAHYLEDANPGSPTFGVNLQCFIQGSLIQAQSGAVAYQELTHTQAAEKARATCQNWTRCSVQKGGVLYAHQACMMVQKKVEDDTQRKAEKAERELERLRKEVIRDRKRLWKPVFQELKRVVRKQQRKERRISRHG